jgi:hypothetical protein
VLLEKGGGGKGGTENGVGGGKGQGREKGKGGGEKGQGGEKGKGGVEEKGQGGGRGGGKGMDKGKGEAEDVTRPLNRAGQKEGRAVQKEHRVGQKRVARVMVGGEVLPARLSALSREERAWLAMAVSHFTKTQHAFAEHRRGAAVLAIPTANDGLVDAVETVVQCKVKELVEVDAALHAMTAKEIDDHFAGRIKQLAEAVSAAKQRKGGGGTDFKSVGTASLPVAPAAPVEPDGRHQTPP